MLAVITILIMMGCMSTANKTLRRSLMVKIEALRAELATCTTAAQRFCVQATLDDARRQLQVAYLESVNWAPKAVAS